VLPAVRHLTVTLSSRELRRFHLVLLLISNECSSLVAATSTTATNLRIYASASFAFCIFQLIVIYFFLSLFLSLSPAELLSPFYFRQSRPPSERNDSSTRSLVHSPILLLFVVAHETSRS